jgi:REP element-mobilizing transposase RayT
MSRAYKIQDQGKPYFITFAVVEWIDLFTRKEYCELIVESIKYCQREKGLIVHAYVIMPSHVHMIIGTKSKNMQGIIRDMKSFTSRKIKEEIKTHPQESRRAWLLQMFEKAGLNNVNNKNWQLWQQDNQPVELWDNYMIENKLDYLHNNPVEAGYVYEPENYVYSSALDYAGQKGLIEIECLE